VSTSAGLGLASPWASTSLVTVSFWAEVLWERNCPQLSSDETDPHADRASAIATSVAPRCHRNCQRAATTFRGAPGAQGASVAWADLRGRAVLTVRACVTALGTGAGSSERAGGCPPFLRTVVTLFFKWSGHLWVGDGPKMGTEHEEGVRLLTLEVTRRCTRAVEGGGPSEAVGEGDAPSSTQQTRPLPSVNTGAQCHKVRLVPAARGVLAPSGCHRAPGRASHLESYLAGNWPVRAAVGQI